MQTAKGSFQSSLNHYDITICPFGQKTLSITVVDPIERIQFLQKLLTLNSIGSTTLIKALEKKMLQVKLNIKTIKTAESAVLQMDILVASQFLKPVEQTIYLKKSRDLSESEILKNSVNKLTSKLKNIKANEELNKNSIQCGTILENEKLYNTGNNLQTIAEIRLKKGKYLLCLSFLVKPQNGLMYLYFQNNQKGQVIQNCLFYLPTRTQFIPIEIKKSYEVTQNEENVTFQGHVTQSHPITLRNLVLTAHKID